MRKELLGKRRIKPPKPRRESTVEIGNHQGAQMGVAAAVGEEWNRARV
jgi:hypothetical protein